jgi:glycine dehydrogenase
MSAVHPPFTSRHIGPDNAERSAMLAAVDAESMAALLDRIVPPSIRRNESLPLPHGRTEPETIAMLRAFASQNVPGESMIGMGYHGTITPPVVLRNVLENPAWYTAYTPYQPEISQGRLEALLNFQTMVADLTGLEVANASLLDEGTAAAEAMTLLRRATKHRASAFFVDIDTHPQTINVIRTRAEPLGIEIVIGDPTIDLQPESVFGALLSYPGSSGSVRDLTSVIDALHAAGSMAAVTADILALVVLRSPGSQGADVVVGSTQRFGVPMGFGGPHAAFMAVPERLARSLPGRLVGVSTDTAGRPAMRLALQTREQHIRREKATSNICTAQVLLAVVAGMYAVWHGPDGLRQIANHVNGLAGRFAASVRARSFVVQNATFFDTVTVVVEGQAEAIADRAESFGIDIRVIDGNHVAVSFDETSTDGTLVRLCEAFGVAVLADAEISLPNDLLRTDEILSHAVFNRYRSEHEMLRYIRRLADRDLALDRTMIPLGSCTMKLNATTEMTALTWPEFANVHPFGPPQRSMGYRALIAELEKMLLACTGYDAVSLQPNAGSQGEFAGLLAIRAYHRSRGEGDRVVCLIPSSAHGTNAASAVMAGMEVVVVACDEEGNVDLGDLRSKVTEHAERLAALMVTYPSTHGVFETAISEICALVHDHGGQVYVDGANLNALVGLAAPGRFGADVSHLNLHKTFCIPHGGGGPGVGPVAVRSHLAPFLPGDPLDSGDPLRTGDPLHSGDAADQAVGPVASAPFGSASILTISWAYITLMGAEGLVAATSNAILNANYVARRLDTAFPVLYRGQHGDVAHECIIDLRPITKSTGVTVDDVAKRLIDFGFHSPTMSFPVTGTLMIEPTESEGKRELDRFCDAMLAIRAELAQIESGEVLVEASALRHAPHTAEDLLAEEWSRPYRRTDGAFPPGVATNAKYFPPVSRIDAAYGDRHLQCSCLPVEAYATR